MLWSGAALGSRRQAGARAAKARAACDYSPFLERAAAVRAGLGFQGKNTCLLVPRKGSWYFLGEVLLDLELPSTEPGESDHCGTCLDCLGHVQPPHSPRRTCSTPRAASATSRSSIGV